MENVTFRGGEREGRDKDGEKGEGDGEKGEGERINLIYGYFSLSVVCLPLLLTF